MVLGFTKMNGAGNDFVLIDNRARTVKLSRDQVLRLCDRHRGVGADGVLLLVPPVSGMAEWAWEFYNSDGSSGEMCGNGARCFSRFVQKLTGLSQGFSFETEAGVITASFQGERVTVSLTRPGDLRLNQQVPLSIGAQTIHSLNTGVPHAVLFVEDVEGWNVVRTGRIIRNHPHFAPSGTNVNFVRVEKGSHLIVRTYERGVEDETLACGTGVVASSLISAFKKFVTSPVSVKTQGGEVLKVHFEIEGKEVKKAHYEGDVHIIYEAEMWEEAYL